MKLHRHKWLFVSAQQEPSRTVGSFGQYTKSVTYVMKACAECQKVKTETHSGLFADQFNSIRGAEAPEAEHDH